MGAVITDNKIQAYVSPLRCCVCNLVSPFDISGLQKRVDGDRRDKWRPLVSVRSSLGSSKWSGRRRVMANRKIIDDSYVRSLLMRNLCSSSSDEDDLTTAAIADDCEATRCKNDNARLTPSSSDEEKMTLDNSNFRSQPVEQATG